MMAAARLDPEPGAFQHAPGMLTEVVAAFLGLPDGVLVFQGRLDFQVKLRGQRIELPEIEAALRGQGAVRDAVVTLYELMRAS